jgi:hypothetical protein
MEKQDAAAGARPPTADDTALRELQAKLDELLQWKRDVSPLLEAIDPPAAARRAERPAATTDDDDPGGIGDDGLSRMLSSSEFSRAVRTEARKLRENPHTLHQVTAWVCFDQQGPDEEWRSPLNYVLGSFTVILLQTAVMWGVFAGTAWPSCLQNSDCNVGDYCPESDDVCSRCLNKDLTPAFTDDRNASNFCRMIHDDSVFMEKQVDGARACETCWDATAGDDWNAVGRSYQSAVQHNARLMRGSDWLALVLSSFSVGLKIAAEIRDITLCQLLVEQKLQQQADNQQPPVRWQPVLRPVLFALAAFRHFGLLPLMAATVPYLVLWRGSAALEICFNAVAVLFLLDLDDEIYLFWIPEETRREMEEDDDRIHIEVDEGEVALLSVTKRLHSALVALSVMLGVAVGGLATGERHLVWPWAWTAFLLAAVIEVIVRASPKSKAVKMMRNSSSRSNSIGALRESLAQPDGPESQSSTAYDRDPAGEACMETTLEAALGAFWLYVVNLAMTELGWLY